MNRANKNSFYLACGVAATGVAFSVLLSSYFEYGSRLQARHLLEQSHRSTIKILNRDIDDIRHQLVQIFGESYSPYFRTLTFQKNAAGRLGVRGIYPVQAWTPIANAGASAFRAALSDDAAAESQIVDGRNQIIDRTRSSVPAARAAILQSKIEGTNLFLRSKGALSSPPLILGLLLLLISIFWCEIGYILYLLIDLEPARQIVPSLPVEVAIADDVPDVTMNANVFFNYLNHTLTQEFDPGSALALGRITLMNANGLKELAHLLNQQLAKHGFFAQHLNAKGELYISFEAEKINQLRHLLRKVTEIARMKSIDVRGLKLNGGVIYSHFSASEAGLLVERIKNSQTYLFSAEELRAEVRPTFLKFTADIDHNVQVVSYEQSLALQKWGDQTFGKNPMFTPVMPAKFSRAKQNDVPPRRIVISSLTM